MRRFLTALAVLVGVGAVALWFLSGPERIALAEIPIGPGDPEKGRYVFYAAGCASCHAAPGAKGEAKLRLAGGLGLKTPFGTFYAPNISPDLQDGIGGWSVPDFVNAVMRGVSPTGAHYYPSFPYMSYQRMEIAEVVDLKAFIDTLEPVTGRAPDHDLPLPLQLRRGLGLWKRMFMDNEPFVPDPGATDQINRGAYLVTGPGHCGECHTPRNLLGAPDPEWAFAGAPNPEGKGVIPNITPHADGIGSWSQGDIVTGFKTGLLPEFETFGGAMTLVQENMAKLTDDDLAAIAAYLKALPPKPSRFKKKADGS